jgi:hypothetical protein
MIAPLEETSRLQLSTGKVHRRAFEKANFAAAVQGVQTIPSVSVGPCSSTPDQIGIQYEGEMSRED